MLSQVALLGTIAAGRRLLSSFTPPYVLSLVNPGAESGSASGWTAAPSAGLWTSENRNTVSFPSTTYEGSRYFHAGTIALAQMYQDIDVTPYSGAIAAGNVVAEMSARFITRYTYLDNLTIFLRALDGSGSVLTSVLQEGIVGGSLSYAWALEDLNLLLPAGTQKVRIELQANRLSVTNNDVFVDDIKLTLYSNARRIAPRYSHAIGKGNRTSLITISATNLVTFGTLSSLVDGANTNSCFFNGATNDGTGWLTFDFGAGNAYVIDEFIWKQQNESTHGVWRLEGSSNNSSWTQIGSDFTLRAGLIQPGGTNNTAYRYYRLRAMTGSRSASPYLYEIEFRAK